MTWLIHHVERANGGKLVTLMRGRGWRLINLRGRTGVLAYAIAIGIGDINMD